MTCRSDDPTLFAKLAAPFPREAVQFRVGSRNADKTRGMALAYVDARTVMDRLDEVVGPANWQDRYTHNAPIVICEIGILIDGTWVWKADGGGASDIEAEKGACSDAFKRAAVRWGIGRYLYELESVWVPLVNEKQIDPKVDVWALLDRNSAPKVEIMSDKTFDIIQSAFGKIGVSIAALVVWSQKKADNWAEEDKHAFKALKERIKNGTPTAEDFMKDPKSYR